MTSDEHSLPVGKHRGQEPIEKIRRLPDDKPAEVKDFVDFLRQRQEERRLAQAVSGASEAGVREGLGQPGRCRV